MLRFYTRSLQTPTGEVSACVLVLQGIVWW